MLKPNSNSAFSIRLLLSLLDHSSEQQPAERPVDGVEGDEERHPGGGLSHRVAEDVERGRFYGGEKDRDDERKQQQRKKGLLRPDLGGHRGVERTGGRET